MRVVVFGGSGFLGNDLAEALVNADHQVVVFDLKKLGRPDLNFEMVIGDIEDRKRVADALSDADIVYNMAGMSDIDDCIKDPVGAVKSNILGNTILLDECVKARIKRYVFASTLYVYSSAGGFYRSTKQASESIIEDYSEYYGINFTILRYGTPYGPNAGPGNSVFRFLKQACDEKKIDYPGTGSEVREYIHVHDAARLSLKILDEEYENERVILSGPHPVRIKDFLVMINEIFGNVLQICYMNSASKNSDTHYQVTPYSYNPKIAKKLVADSYLDLGQGILDCIEAIKKESVF